MTIATMDALVAGITSGQRRFWNKSNPPNLATATYVSLWRQGGSPGAASVPPTGTGEVPTNATAGALPFTNPGGANLAYLAQSSMGAANNGIMTLYDRLWHNSGLVANITTSQTVGSLALTRPDATGTNVECWVECYTATGATGQSLSVSYTDAVNGSGRAGTVAIPANMPAQRMVPMTNQAGDYNVASVQSCQFGTSTGTAGNFGIVLLRRIADIPIPNGPSAVDRDAFTLGLPQLYSNACLSVLVFCGNTTMGPFIGCYSVAIG